MTQTRRTFLELSAFGLAAVAAAKTIRSTTVENPPQTAKKLSPISVWVTSDSERFASSPSIAWDPSSASPGAEPLQLIPQTRYQEILGFGGAFTDAACYTFNRLSPSAREQLFHEMFHPSQIGLSVGRVCVGSSDYATKVYSFDEGEADPELTRFSIEHDREYILPILRQARVVNPDLFLFSSPWSPPGWMKFNGSMLGGSMRNHYLAAYAKYYLKFLKAYAAEQVPAQALTSQNEVDTDQDGRMPACIWPQEYEIQFVRDHLLGEVHAGCHVHGHTGAGIDLAGEVGRDVAILLVRRIAVNRNQLHSLRDGQLADGILDLMEHADGLLALLLD